MTEKQYQIAVARLLIEQPEHPLIGDLKKGFSKFNVIYLKHILSTVQVIKTTSIVQDKETIIAKLKIEQSDLFATRSRLSNRLRDYPLTAHFDHHRAEIMDQIRVLQQKIAKVMRDFEWIKEHGAPMPDSTSSIIPSDPAERERKKYSLRGSISHKRRDLSQILRGGVDIDEDLELERIAILLDESPFSSAVRGKIVKGFEKLKTLKKHLQDVEKAIEIDTIRSESI